jgi:hypothetical protein
LIDHGRSQEFEFLVSCCRRAFQIGYDIAAIGVSEDFDWDRFVRLARFHRVQGLVWKGVNATGQILPEAASAALLADAKGIAFNNLKVAAECQGLNAAFTSAGVPLLFVKGLTLAKLAYGECSSKAANDIDLIVSEDSLDEASRTLVGRGYNLVEPATAPAPAQVVAWHANHKESLWRHSESGIHVDLHSRLADSPMLIPGIGLDSALQQVTIASGISLPTLCDDELFAYLAVHGASSAWFRLKWVVDFAALTHRCAADRIEKLYERAQSLGAGRAAGQALLVSHALFGTLDALPVLIQQMRNDRATSLLGAIALKQLAKRAEPVEPTAHLLGTAAIHYSQLLLLPGWRFAASELMRQIRAAFASRRR